MSIDELRKAVISDDELSFSHNGRNYLLYGWNQCDGYFLSLECEGELLKLIVLTNSLDIILNYN